MKILKLRFKNLNSLYGEWSIDFTNSRYTEEGIFLISGPTGSGKTTILDAICLALYGMTPRLEKISKSGNEIMSKGTAECFAEVEFQTTSGQFRSFWSQSRVKKSSTGGFADAKHEIASYNPQQKEYKILNSKKKDVAKTIEETTGMNFTRFKRSIMLAQGDFSGFLMANANDKAPILEQITGTEIYGEISVAAYYKHKEEKQRLEELRVARKEIEILDADSEAEIEEQIKGLAKEKNSSKQNLDQLNEQISRVTRIEELNKELAATQEAFENLKKNELKIKEQRQLLENAKRADAFDSEINEIKILKENIVKGLAESKQTEELIPRTEALINSFAQEIETFKQSKESESKLLSDLENLVEKVKILDEQIRLKSKDFSTLNEEKRAAIAELEDSNTNLTEINNKLDQTRDIKASSSKYLSENIDDKEISSEFRLLSEKITNANLRNKEITCAKEDLEELKLEKVKISSQIVDISNKIKQQETALQNTKLDKEQSQAKANKVLGGSTKEELTSEITRLKDIHYSVDANLELSQQRALLEDGQPCPLCGSLSHPLTAEESELKRQKEELRLKIEKCQAIINEVADLEKLMLEFDSASNREQNILLDLQREQKSLEEKANSNAEKSLAAEKSLQKLNDEKLALDSYLEPLIERYNSSPSNLLEILQKRIAEYTRQEKIHQENRELSLKLEGEKERFTEKIESTKKRIEEISNKLEILGLEKIIQDRKNLFGDKDPEIELTTAKTKLSSIDKKIEETSQEKGKRERELEGFLATIKIIKKSTNDNIQRLKSLEEEISTKLIENGFSDIENLLSAKLTKSQQDEILKDIDQHKTQQTRLETQINEKELSIENIKRSLLSDKDLPVLQGEKLLIEEKIESCEREISNLQSKLSINENQQEKARELSVRIENQSKETEKWAKLSELIGSAKGDKFRIFAQKITFDAMIHQANQQLKKMSDRFLLISNPDPEKALEFSVIDNYQAGEIRSTKNLSGGETFLISLSLALGLSKMSSRKVKVDSLFLDEGFGTLDEDALEMAIETLSNLKQDEKTIGIISHVATLKERINNQIKVTTVNNGKSKLSGPGCVYCGSSSQTDTLL
ncbi:MAG: AAA family ATPase [Spirochaetales bacterium]|nr:AAA family ATPase [Spirochaetales bacterium]